MKAHYFSLLLKWTLRSLVGIVLFFLLIYWSLQLPVVQRLITDEATHYLNEKLGTKVDIQAITLGLPKSILVEGFYLEDQQEDTLFYFQVLELDLDLSSLLRQKIRLNKVKLNQSTVAIKRNTEDSVFNYNFVLSGFQTDTMPLEQETDSSEWTCEIDEILLKKVKINYLDKKDTIDFSSQIGSLQMALNSYDLTSVIADAELEITDFQSKVSTSNEHFSFSLEHNKIDLNYLDIDRWILDIDDWDITRPIVLYEKLNTSTTEASSQNTHASYLLAERQLNCRRLAISNAHLKYDDPTPKKTQQFDAHHIDIQDFDVSLVNFSLDKELLSAQLRNLSLSEKNGFDLCKASCGLQATESSLGINNLVISTANSHIQSDLKLSYPSLQKLIDQPETIDFQWSLMTSNVGSNDLRYFWSGIDSLDFSVAALDDLSFDAQVHGSPNDMEIQHFKTFYQGDSLLYLSGQMEHALDINKMDVDLKIATYHTLGRMIPRSIPDLKIMWPRHILSTSKIKGGLQNLIASVVIQSDQGALQLEGKYKNQTNLSYQLDLVTKGLALGYLLQEPRLGQLDMQIGLKGSGTISGKIKANWQGEIARLVIDDYAYQQIQMSGNFKEQLAHGEIQINDPNLVANLVGDLNLKQDMPHTKLLLNIAHENISALSEGNQTKGSIALDIIGVSLDSIKLAVKSTDFTIAKAGVIYELAPAQLDISTGASHSLLTMSSPFLEGTFEADFPLLEWPGVITDKLLPSLMSSDSTVTEDLQGFMFEVTDIQTDLLRELFIPDLEALEVKKLEGKYDTELHALDLTIDIPKLVYQEVKIDTLIIDAKSTKSGLSFNSHLKKLSFGTVLSQAIAIDAAIINSETNINFSLTDSLQQIPLQLTAKINATDTGYVVNIPRDSITLGYKSWHVNPSNQLRMSAEGIDIQHLSFDRGKEAFSIQNERQKPNSTLTISFDQFNLANISRLLSSDTHSFSGKVQGVTSFNFEDDLAFSSDLSIREVTYSKDTLGDLEFQVERQNSNRYDLSLQVNSNKNAFQGTGYYLASSDSIHLMMELAQLDLSTLEGFLADYVENLTGQLTGNFDIQGLINDPSILGSLTFNQARFNTTYLGAAFHLQNETIVFKNDQILFDHFKLYDARRNSAVINGYVGSADLQSPIFKLDVSTDKFLMLDTQSTGEKEELYFGSLVISSQLKIRGNANKPTINARVKIIEGSELTIIVPETVVETVEYDGIVQFISPNDEVPLIDSLTSHQSELKGISVQANLELRPEAKLKVLMDRSAGDYLEVRGESNLSYSILPNGETNLSGVYEVTEGSYKLTFYNFVKKQFNLKAGSKIQWTGDPYNARLSAKATYLANTSPLPLVESQLTSSDLSARNVYQQSLPFIVGLNIEGEIKSPKISFDIEMAPEKISFQSGVIAQKILQLNTQESELNKQVFSLLIFNRFLPENSFSGGASGALSSTARQSVSKLLTQQLNSLTGKYIKGVQINMDLESFEDYSTGKAQGRTDLKLELSKELFNERLIVTLGSNVKLEGENKSTQVADLAQDIVLEYRLTENGVYRLKAFRKNQYEGVIDGDLTKTGVGFSFGKEFNSWETFFKTLNPTKEK